MNERMINENWKDVFSILGNAVAIITFIFTYFINVNVLKLIAIILCVTSYVFLFIRNKRVTNELRKNKTHIEELKKDNTRINNSLQVIVDDIIDGRFSSELMGLCFGEERKNKHINYLGMKIKVFIDYIENNPYLDVKYCWEIKGQNISDSQNLNDLYFIISGDANIINNNDLNMITEIERDDGDGWIRLNHSISGGVRIKLLNIQFGNHIIEPNQTFKIRFSYVWAKSYCAAGDRFSFGANSSSLIHTPQMNIEIESSKKCFKNALLEVRNQDNEEEYRIEHQKLCIVEREENEVATASLSQCQNKRAVYVILNP